MYGGYYYYYYTQAKRLPNTLYEEARAWNESLWRLACARGGDDATHDARARVLHWFVEEWAPQMAYPYAQELWRNRTTQFDWAVDASWAPLREVATIRRCLRARRQEADERRRERGR